MRQESSSIMPHPLTHIYLQCSCFVRPEYPLKITLCETDHETQFYLGPLHEENQSRTPNFLIYGKKERFRVTLGKNDGTRHGRP